MEVIDVSEGGEFQIDCGACVMQGTAACDDCVVSAILDRPEGAVVFDAAAERALRAMGSVGLIPVCRFEPKPKAG